MLHNDINLLVEKKQNYFSVFQLLITGAARDFHFSFWEGDSESVCLMYYLQFDPPFKGQTT